MRKQLLIILFASSVISGCSAQSYSVAGSGVYLGNASYSSSNMSINAGYSSGPGWYGYPWYSSAYLRPVYPGYWPGYVSIGYGPGGFYGGFNWNWGYYPPRYYRYPGYWGYNPYYGHGYRGQHRHGPYRRPAYRPHYAYSPYRHNYRGNYGDEYYGYSGGAHEYDRRDRGGNDHHPRKFGKQPVRVVRLPAHQPERGYSGNRAVNRSGAVRSGSGHSAWKGDQSPPQRLHQSSVKQVRQVKPQPVNIVRREPRVVERDAGYTPPRSSSAQRSASGRNHYKGSQPPPQQLHSGKGQVKSRKSVTGTHRPAQTKSGSVSWSPARQQVSYQQSADRQAAAGKGTPMQKPMPQPRQQVHTAPDKVERKQNKNESGKNRSNKRDNKRH